MIDVLDPAKVSQDFLKQVLLRPFNFVDKDKLCCNL